MQICACPQPFDLFVSLDEHLLASVGYFLQPFVLGAELLHLLYVRHTPAGFGCQRFTCLLAFDAQLIVLSLGRLLCGHDDTVVLLQAFVLGFNPQPVLVLQVHRGSVCLQLSAEFDNHGRLVTVDFLDFSHPLKPALVLGAETVDFSVAVNGIVVGNFGQQFWLFLLSSGRQRGRRTTSSCRMANLLRVAITLH